MEEPPVCTVDGMPLLADGRTCSFCKKDNLEVTVSALKQKVDRLVEERNNVLKENSNLRDRIADLLLICEIEGRPISAVPINPRDAS